MTAAPTEGSSAGTVFDPGLELAGVNTIRALSLDAVHKAQSGHQGTAMALAPTAHVLFTRVMNYDASDPHWPDRDRFVLSVGHASILLYSMLHLTGHGLEMEDLKQFRQWGSATPGHPEAGHTDGVEVTTGPLGQGFANAVGMAMAERHLRARYGTDLCDHRIYVLAGDGDLSEGVSHEAASLAGHLGLDRLTVVYDDNRITIDGPTDLALSDDPVGRFEAYGWTVSVVEDATDLDAIEAAFEAANAVDDAPSLIVLRSRIGYPSPSLTGHHSAHGNPFDDAEIAATKAAMDMDPDAQFAVGSDVQAMYRAAGARGKDRRAAWEQRLADSTQRDDWNRQWDQTPTVDLDVSFEVGKKIATRQTSQTCLQALTETIPNLFVGSADLTGSTGTDLGDATDAQTSAAGRQVRFGVREHAMGAAMVGAACHGGVIPVGGTFLVFADYMRPAVRLAAMSKANCVFVWTHDSVGVGEDGPTHQPIEQLMSLRAIPGLTVIRPADGTETIGAWETALATDGPTALILSRQGLPVLEASRSSEVANGAYRLVDADNADITLIGTGSEVQVCVEAAERLAADGVAARVVSMPSWERFDQLSDEARSAVIDPGVPALSVEAGVTLGWHRYANYAVGIDRFGASAPGSTVLDELGINADAVVSAAQQLLAR